MDIEIFDIDGTLTHDYSDRPLTGYKTYEYWTLVSQRFTTNIHVLEHLIENWEKGMATGKDPITCTHHLMQETLQTLHSHTTGQAVREFAKNITLHFIQHDIIQNLGVKHLNNRINEGITCVLATAGYEDGALGFLDGLVIGGLMTEANRSKVRLTGTVVDWEKKIILHLNVKELKLVGIERLFSQSMTVLKPDIKAVYANDPWFNDGELLTLAPPGQAYIIPCIKYQNRKLSDDYIFTSWQKIFSAK